MTNRAEKQREVGGSEERDIQYFSRARDDRFGEVLRSSDADLRVRLTLNAIGVKWGRGYDKQAGGLRRVCYPMSG